MQHASNILYGKHNSKIHYNPYILAYQVVWEIIYFEAFMYKSHKIINSNWCLFLLWTAERELIAQVHIFRSSSLSFFTINHRPSSLFIVRRCNCLEKLSNIIRTRFSTAQLLILSFFCLQHQFSKSLAILFFFNFFLVERQHDMSNRAVISLEKSPSYPSKFWLEL